MNKKTFLLWFVPVLVIIFSMPLCAAEIGKRVEITYLGHSAFKIVSPNGVVVYIDPWMSGNPKFPKELKTVEKADFILVTHGHFDHIGDTLAMAAKLNPKIVVIEEFKEYLTQKGAKDVVHMNKGGTYTTSHGIAITMVNASHTSSVNEANQIHYIGDPVGFVIKFENGFTLYFAGDTEVFGDMKIIGEIYNPELSFLPIGSRFTMAPKEAVYAAKLLGSKYVIPIHYGTYPSLTGTAEEFLELMKDVPQIKVLVLKPGETVQ
jgi:L-ascorbate metabolism protein UlaG (beta-lactamase superfamily)